MIIFFGKKFLMNKYYYIINLFDSIDRLFLFTYWSTAYYFAIIGFILFIVAVIASIPVYIYKKLKDTVCFYIVMSVFFCVYIYCTYRFHSCSVKYLSCTTCNDSARQSKIKQKNCNSNYSNFDNGFNCFFCPYN